MDYSKLAYLKADDAEKHIRNLYRSVEGIEKKTEFVLQTDASANCFDTGYVRFRFSSLKEGTVSFYITAAVCALACESVSVRLLANDLEAASRVFAANGGFAFVNFAVNTFAAKGVNTLDVYLKGKGSFVLDSLTVKVTGENVAKPSPSLIAAVKNSAGQTIFAEALGRELRIRDVSLSVAQPFASLPQDAEQLFSASGDGKMYAFAVSGSRLYRAAMTSPFSLNELAVSVENAAAVYFGGWKVFKISRGRLYVSNSENTPLKFNVANVMKEDKLQRVFAAIYKGKVLLLLSGAAESYVYLTSDCLSYILAGKIPTGKTDGVYVYGDFFSLLSADNGIVTLYRSDGSNVEKLTLCAADKAVQFADNSVLTASGNKLQVIKF